MEKINCDFKSFVFVTFLNDHSDDESFKRFIRTVTNDSFRPIFGRLIDEKYKDIIDRYSLNETDLTKEEKDFWLIYLSLVDKSKMEEVINTFNKIESFSEDYTELLEHYFYIQKQYELNNSKFLRMSLGGVEKKWFEELFEKNLLTIDNFDPNNEFLTHIHLMDKCREGEEV